MAIVLEASAFAAMGRSRLSFWKMLYGVRSATSCPPNTAMVATLMEILIAALRAVPVYPTAVTTWSIFALASLLWVIYSLLNRKAAISPAISSD